MRAWTTSEMKVMRLFASLGREGVAKLLDRSPTSVAMAAKKNGISLKRTGEDINLNSEVILLLSKVAETSRLDICPMCGRHWATMPTGICRVCHLDRLISIYREQVDVEDRQRTLAASRQDRRRKKVAGEAD